MKALKIALMSLSLLLISSCDWFVKEKVVTQYVYLPVSVSVAEKPRALMLNDISFDVVSESNLEQFLNENEKRNGTIVFIAIDVNEYEALSSNVAELRRYIEQQMDIIEFYEKSIQETREKADELNKVSETEKTD
jgi:ABC-type Mn2+/Zn2+ transport system ATPase subunit